MDRVRLIFHWVVLLTMLAATTSLADCCGSDSGSDPLCGPKSLLLICSELGVPADLDELAQLAEGGHAEIDTRSLALNQPVDETQFTFSLVGARQYYDKDTGVRVRP